MIYTQTNNSYLQLDVLSFLSTPLPFKEIFYFAKKNHDPSWRQIEKEIVEIAKKNKEQVIDLLSTSMIKLMQEEITLESVTEETLKETNKKIEYLNNQFEHLNKYFEGLSPNDQRKLLLPFIDKELIELNKHKREFKTKVDGKKVWNSNDAMIYSYYLVYQDNINFLYNTLKKVNQERVKNVINLIKSSLLFYKPVLLAYMLGKNFDNEILAKRLAELRSSFNPKDIYPYSPKIYEVYKELFSVSPI